MASVSIDSTKTEVTSNTIVAYATVTAGEYGYYRCNMVAQRENGTIASTKVGGDIYFQSQQKMSLKGTIENLAPSTTYRYKAILYYLGHQGTDPATQVAESWLWNIRTASADTKIVDFNGDIIITAMSTRADVGAYITAYQAGDYRISFIVTTPAGQVVSSSITSYYRFNANDTKYLQTTVTHLDPQTHYILQASILSSSQTLNVRDQTHFKTNARPPKPTKWSWSNQVHVNGVPYNQPIRGGSGVQVRKVEGTENEYNVYFIDAEEMNNLIDKWYEVKYYLEEIDAIPPHSQEFVAGAEMSAQQIRTLTWDMKLIDADCGVRDVFEGNRIGATEFIKLGEAINYFIDNY